MTDTPGQPARRPSGSTFVVVGAMAADAAVAAAKFVAAALTGSSAMLAEGVHSVIDASNSGLLLLGERRGRRPPDRRHPFGHGLEVYFWSLIVAILIFGLGGGVSTYEGVTHLLHPKPPEDPTVSYWVLGVSAAFGAGSFWLGLRGFRGRMRPDESWWRTFRRSKDPSIYTVVFEDAAALLGILFAFLGVFLGHRLASPWPDGIASVAIGLMMAVVACLLAWESRGLLVGETADLKEVEDTCRIASADPDVVRVDRPLTLQLGPHEVLLTINVQFREGLTVRELEATVDRLEASIRQRHPDVKRIFIEAESLRQGGAENHREKPPPPGPA